ncbi:alpha-1,3-mannosyl-glycoprotein 2-beta-N-acetylglucosaminyltransferase isoform X1 [Neodiprion pinetum]|uniref:alpha-1,3-mannosyl-glycoprotein 2-beta-N-acetylglucosaminyltransferase isoform X1 n=1 Tax=Neodiprion pinetum TaxID=441929 RepID=UPI001EDF0DE3|nr:alpha-1,3-mannosyl-glycoprotein 2-beta-N-acetylglucosaminyltransferase isoform X1 [Neodiprion pinetum]XP_046480651.1 alpha-1,3-mannosyl-glycoprotein 2-beta-N-acetylglucosaminyltransferase isoform X1 [Neodiprion pinetum]
MRKKSISFIFASLCVWGVITYFLFLDRPIGKEQDKGNIAAKIRDIEERVKEQFAENKKLIQHLRGKLQDQNEAENAESTVVKNAEEAQNAERDKLEAAEEDLKIQVDEAQHVAPEKSLRNEEPVIAVLVFSCNRVTVKRCLDQLIRLRPSAEQFPIIVSQDCEHEPTTNVIQSYGEQLTHIRQPDQSDIDIPPKEKKFKGYFKIARHYGWALNQVFLEFGFETAIIVEDDLDVAPDFFEYFLGTYPLLVKDNSLWCISAWNDNGKSELVDDSGHHLLYRTDFFPGLGWMLTKDIWMELGPKWPKSYWDDWIRKPEQRKDRACIRPELSRTRTFGKIGVSNGLFYEKHLKFIKLNDVFVPFTKMNLTYLLKDNYDMAFVNEVYQSRVVNYSELKSDTLPKSSPVRIPYHTRQAYKNTAKMLGLMDDFRSGVPRTSYRGVVTFFYRGRRVHLAPNANWAGYDITWS